MLESGHSKTALVVFVALVGMFVIGCGGGLKYRVEDKVLARVAAQDRRALDPHVTRQQTARQQVEAARKARDLAEHKVELADSKEELAEGRVEHAEKTLEGARKNNDLKALASAEAQLDIARHSYQEAAAALALSKDEEDVSDAELTVAEKKATLADAMLELEKAKLARGVEAKLSVSDFEKQVATARKQLGTAEEELADRRKTVENARATHKAAERNAAKVRMKYGTSAGL